ncbi:MAG: D-amino acid dehydrogenase [Gammaproteobacteria bacterium]|nr:D-amino acid dehydrogenase [Gammaproteobacteria bacterium]
MRIIVIGSGLMGLASAYYLSEHGHEVTVIDRQQGPALETSFANAGVIHSSQAGPWNAPGIALQVLKWMGKEDSPFLLRPNAIPSLIGWGLSFIRHSRPNRFRANLKKNAALASYNIQCMQEFLEQHPFDYCASSLGVMKVIQKEQDMEKEIASMSFYKSVGIQNEVLNQAEIFSKEPALIENGQNLIGGIYFPGDQAGDAYQFCVQLTDLLRKKNVQFEYDLTVDEFLTSNNVITAIKTSKGEYSGDSYVLAAGSYSPLLTKKLGLNIPIRPVKGYSITLDMSDWEAKPLMPIIDDEAHVAITPLGNQLRAAGTAELNGYKDEINQYRIQLVLDQVINRYPEAKKHINYEEINSWCGFRPITVDGVPIIGDAPTYKNLYLNTGHGHLGWTLAMGSGKLVADNISGHNTTLDIGSYALNRF